MSTKFFIHNSISYTGEEIAASIENMKELPGVYTSTYSDGTVIADPRPNIEDWTRNKEDYRVEELSF